MRKIYLTVLMALFAAMTTNASNEKNPAKGLYRLQKFIYEDGRQSPPGFSQYKYVADSVGLLVSFRPSWSATQWSSMSVEIREPYPLLFTGEKPQGTDGHGTQIFDVDDRQFSFKWYNEKWPGMSNLREFITEVYTKDSVEKEVAAAFNLLEDKIDRRANRFYGWWVRVGATANPDGTGQRMQVPVIWKAYGPELSMVARVANNGMAIGGSTTNTVRYESDTTIYEIGHRCDIHWLNDDSHTLTFVQENGQPLTEIWVRGGLPEKWQRVFNTHLEAFRDGTGCVRDAVAIAVQGDLQQADGLISEAMERSVSIEVLSEGTMAIAMDLLTNKQQYKDCLDFCGRQLQRIKDYANGGHEHNMFSKLHVHLTELCKALATYRNGDTENGKRLMEERLSVVDSEIERYKAVKGMERYINLLYYCNYMTYQLGYDILGTERTLLYLDALTLMAPDVTNGNKPLLLNCRGCCYLLDGDTESARRLWLQIKELAPDFFKNQPADNPLKKAFGE